MYRFPLAFSALAAAVSLVAQNAQLPRKGRRPDDSKPQALAPIREKLTKTMAPAFFQEPGELELQAYIQKLRAGATQPMLAQDRLRPLIHGSVMPLIVAAEMPIRNVLTYPPPVTPSVAVLTSNVMTEAVPNRWRIFPAGLPRRYGDPTIDAVYAGSHPWDPFDRNVLKGDYPVLGRRWFFDFSGSSETLTEIHRIPVPSNQSSAEPGEFGFFGRGGEFALQQNFRLSFDLFRGSAGFRPVDYEIRITPEFNINYLQARENGLTDINVAQGIRRTDSAVGWQEAFFEKRLFTNSGESFRKRRQEDDRGSAYFDFTSLRLGIQRFTSDFRGFVFSDEQPGARLFGTFHNNVFQYNLAYFSMLEKDTNSGLNNLRTRQQSVSAANVYWNDFLTKGYNLNFSVLYNHDQPSFLIDRNGFLVRPAPAGSPLPHEIRAAYVGITGDGHIGRFNVSNAFYDAFGRDQRNPITGRPEHINAQLAALEIAYEKDWMTFKVSAFFTSGERHFNSGQATGFDGIVPNQQFAGGGFLGDQALADRGLINNQFEAGGVNFLNREVVPLSGTALALFGPNNLIPAMRAGAFEGQANFVNPGILLYNAGFDAKITPKIRSSINVNYASFDNTQVLEAVLMQNNIRHSIGVDSGIGLQYRPLLSENIVITSGFGTLVPGAGFKDIFDKRVLFSGFVNIRVAF